MVKYISIIFFLFTTSAYSYNLSFYREQYDIHTQQSTKSKQRLDQLRLLLGTANLHFPELEQKTGPFASSFSNILEHERSGSYLFKQTFAQVIAALQEDATHGMAMPFDPSDSQEDQKAKLHDHQMQIFKEVMRKKLGTDVTESNLVKRVLDDFWFNFSQDNFEDNAERAEYEIRVRPNLDQIDGNTKALVTSIQKYLSQANRFCPCKQTFEQVLGTLFQVDVIDGVVTKLRFKLPQSSETPGETLSLTLMSVINFKTDQDKYFLDTLDLFLEYVSPTVEKDITRKNELDTESEKLKNESQREEFRKTHKEELQTLSRHIDTKSIIQAKRAGARIVNHALSKLTDLELDILLDLMLVLRGTDLPTADEMGKLSQYLGKFQLNETGDVKNSTEKEVFSLVKRDYQFYSALNDQLYNLEEFLKEDIQTDRAVDKLIKSERKQK